MAGGAQLVRHRPNTLPVLSNRILLAADEQERQILRKTGEPFRSIGMNVCLHQVIHALDSEKVTAERVRHVLIHDGGIPGQPVKLSPALKVLSVGTEGHLVQDLAFIGFALYLPDGGGHNKAGFGRWIGPA